MKIDSKFYIPLYFLILLILVVATPLPLDPKIRGPVSFDSTVMDIIIQFGLQDAASFAKGALSIYKNNSLEPNLRYIFNLWPPGFILLEVIILKVFGTQAPLAGIIQLLAIFSFAIVLNFFRIYLSYYTNTVLAVLIPCLLLCSSLLSSFMIGARWVLFGETFSISFTLDGIFLLLLAYHNTNKKLAIIAGVCFALSAYFRSQFETFFMIATFNLIMIMLIWKLYEKRKQVATTTSYKLNSELRSALILIMFSLISFHALTIPYKIYNGSFLWVKTSQLILSNNFIPTEELTKENAQFLIAGGANTGCLVDETNCIKIRKQIINNELLPEQLKNIALITLLKHPYKWLSLKANLLPQFWFNHQYRDLAAYNFHQPIKSIDIFNYIFLCCFIFSIICILLSINNPYSLINFWLSSSICYAYLGIFIITHYEERYFYFFKLYFFSMAIIYGTHTFSKSRVRSNCKRK